MTGLAASFAGVAVWAIAAEVAKHSNAAMPMAVSDLMKELP